MGHQTVGFVAVSVILAAWASTATAEPVMAGFIPHEDQRLARRPAYSWSQATPVGSEAYPADPESYGHNDWFEEFRLFRPLHAGPFRITHPLIPRWTRVPGTNKWIWIENPEDFRAEHARFGNGFQSRAASHRVPRAAHLR